MTSVRGEHTAGMTISSHILIKRIELARIMLENTTYNISEIAEMCGVIQLSYFSRSFKRICRVSPQSYRLSDFKL